jgi:hypothetical protein
MQMPDWHVSEQQSPYWVHEAPAALQVAPTPPHTLLAQS